MVRKPTYEELEQRVFELEKAQEVLQKSIGRWRSMVQNAPSFVTIVDKSHVIEYINRPVSGLELENVVGHSVYDFIQPEYHDIARKKIEAVFIAGQPCSYESVAIGHEGTLAYYDNQLGPIVSADEIIAVSIFGMDITGSKQAEQALRQSEEKYKLITETSQTGIYIHQDDIIMYANDKFAQLHGYTVDELIGTNYFNLFHPDERARALGIKIKRLRGDEDAPQYHETKRVKKDGGILWCQTVAVRIEYQGKPAIMGNVVDITERKLAEEALINSERKWRHILVNTPQIGITLDRDAKIVFANEYLQKLTGWKEEEIIGQNWFDMFIPEEIREEIRNVFKAVMRQKNALGYSTYENDIVTRSGEQRHIAWANVLTKDVRGNILDVTCLGVDLTERIHAEAALVESEKRYKEIAENILLGVYQVTLEGKLIFANQKMAEVFGYDSPQEFMAAVSSIAELYARPEERPVVVDEIIDMGSIIGKEVEFKRKDGRNIWVKLNTRKTTNKDGKVILEGLMEDITELKNLENQLRQAQKMESIGTMTGGIAHDFNNILGIIIGNTELALGDVPEWNPVHANLKEIKTASLRATNIVKQLFSFSRKTDQKLHPIEIASVIEDALKFMRSYIPTTIDFQQDIQAMDETVLADPIQINQIMMNLCINAAQAMEQTGGNLTVTLGKVTLNDNSVKDYPDLRSGKHVKVTVSDTGPGIAPEIINRIFDPYFTTKEVGKGSGMGLSVVQGIVKNYNGAIFVESKPGNGTTFSIFFPVATEKSVMEIKPPDQIPRGNESILFIDDEESIAKMTQQMLERLGYKVKTEMNPVEALEQFKLKPYQFDLIITDMTMPKMTGVMLSEKIMEIRPDIPVIICTGYSALIDEERARRLGIAAYVMKPINITEIANTIRKVLGEVKSSAHD